MAERLASPTPIFDTFCSGHAFLRDGRLLVAGGTSAYPPPEAPPQFHHQHYRGVRNAAIFVPNSLPNTNPWIAAAPMHTEPDPHQRNTYLPDGGGRWYPTLLTLPDGNILAVGGHPLDADSRHSNYMLEVFVPTPSPRGSWIDMGDVPDRVRDAGETFRTPDVYPHAHVLPDGRVFFARLLGGGSWIWDPATRTWDEVTQFPAGYVDPTVPDYNRTLFAWTTVLLPLSPNNGYRARVLLVGRAQPFVIELAEDSPTWRPTVPRDRSDPRLFDPSPHRPSTDTVPGNVSGMRQHCLAVLLGNGEVLVLGGSTTDPEPSAGLDRDAVLLPELY